MHNTLQICYLKGCALCRRPLLVKLYYCVFLFDSVGWFCDSDCDAPHVTQDGTLARRHPHKTPLQKIMDRDHLFILRTLDPRFGIPRHPLRNPMDPQDPVRGGIQLFVSPIGQPFEIMTKMELPHLICVISSIPTPPYPICWPHASLSPPHPTPKRIDGCILLTQHLT